MPQWPDGTRAPPPGDPGRGAGRRRARRGAHRRRHLRRERHPHLPRQGGVLGGRLAEPHAAGDGHPRHVPDGARGGLALVPVPVRGGPARRAQRRPPGAGAARARAGRPLHARHPEHRRAAPARRLLGGADLLHPRRRRLGPLRQRLRRGAAPAPRPRAARRRHAPHRGGPRPAHLPALRAAGSGPTSSGSTSATTRRTTASSPPCGPPPRPTCCSWWGRAAPPTSPCAWGSSASLVVQRWWT